MLKPYMLQQEIAVLDFVLYTLHPRRVLEYGAGGSTVRWSRLPWIREWVSVEHDPMWFGKVANAAPDATVVTGSADVGSLYARSPGIKGRFDLILVDGLFRVDCIQASPDYLTERGVVILHDASRDAYHDAWDTYPSLVHLSPGDGHCNGLMAMWGQRC